MAQKVYLSRTRSGQPGLFTNGTLAYPLTVDEAKDIVRVKEIAARARFEFMEEPR